MNELFQSAVNVGVWVRSPSPPRPSLPLEVHLESPHFLGSDGAAEQDLATSSSVHLPHARCHNTSKGQKILEAYV